MCLAAIYINSHSDDTHLSYILPQGSHRIPELAKIGVGELNLDPGKMDILRINKPIIPIEYMQLYITLRTEY